MKLRNKKTGEYGRFMMCHDEDNYLFYIQTDHHKHYYCDFEGKFIEDWEVCQEPKEPLIKDEKIRKAVRAWAWCNLLVGDDRVFLSKPTFDCKILSLEHGRLNFDVYYDDESLCNKEYTIAELCGDEE